jgi:hypothetical protein
MDTLRDIPDQPVPLDEGTVLAAPRDVHPVAAV